MMLYKTILLFVLGLVFAHVDEWAIADEWNDANDPRKIDSNYEMEFDRLPLSATLPGAKMPWSETYWPSEKGSINLRWNQPNPVGFKYRSPSREQVLAMSREELARLAPSEKYDIYMGHYDYPLKEEVKGIATPRAKEWSGICDGWAAISIQYREPKPVDAINPDGVVVPFGSSDIKGLMSYYAARHVEFEPDQVGLRCNPFSRFLGRSSCSDINPASMHVILANELGKKGEGFVMEIDPGKEVWNQPVYGFEAKIIGSARTSSRGAVRAYHVQSVVYYADELDQSQWAPVTGTASFVVGKLNLSYTIDVDHMGRVVGGDWFAGVHPDFIWKPSKKAVFTGDFAGLAKLYQAVD